MFQEASGSDDDVDGVPLDGAALLKGARPIHTKPQPARYRYTELLLKPAHHLLRLAASLPYQTC
jgi:hypothetical protein